MSLQHRILFAGLTWMAALLLGATVSLALPASVKASSIVYSAPQQDAVAPDPDLADQTLYIPFATRDYRLLATRMGVNAVFGTDNYSWNSQLGAGWYSNWSVHEKPSRPNGIEFAQTIRVHQRLACGAWHHGDRTACPYAQPLDYVYQPDQATLEAAIRANPGSLWIIGNEIDRVDWSDCREFESDGVTCKPDKIVHVGQDEILPETYARAYHDLYTIIKNNDPTAKVAIAGVIQATPLRLAYLTKIWDSYQAQYGTIMPVDVWNVHAFILREVRGEYGADIPPGFTDKSGSYTEPDGTTHMNRTIFDRQIRAMRQWMKDRNQQNLPLIVTEYGVLYRHDNLDNEAVVNDYMLWTFDYFLNTRDCTLGYVADDCALVQRWAWFALDSTSQKADGTLVSALNTYTSLYNTTTRQPMKAGLLFADFVTKNFDALHSTAP